MKYERLNKRLNFVSKRESNSFSMEEEDSICNFFEAGGIERYEFIFNFIQKHKIKNIYDIGCAYGHQSEVFVNSKINYIGIETYPCEYWNKKRYTYIDGNYPFKINVLPNSIAVSCLCIGWHFDKIVDQEISQLSKDFSKALLYIPNEVIPICKKYFNSIQICPEFSEKKNDKVNFYYLQKY